MNRFILSFILVAGLASMSMSQTLMNKGTLTIKLVGFRNNKGQACISLFNQSKGFPGKHEKAIKIMRSGIKNNQTFIVFDDLPYGTYAISVLHDENLNNKMETSFIGIPKEGWAVSNNPKSRFGPPSFDEARFELASNNKTMEVIINYW